MESKKLNTEIEFEFCDGTSAKLTLAFYELLKLRNENKDMYKRYNRCMNLLSKGEGDELDSVTVLYVAYVCANRGKGKLMTEEEFIIKCGSDRKAVSEAARDLTQPKKRKDSDRHLGRAQGQENQR